MKEHIIQKVKSFQNSHLPAVCYKSTGYKKLVLQQEVRWNTLADSFQCYLDIWTMILKVCEEHRDNIDSVIVKESARY